ncbi:uncharacterized protein CIMG_00800 [Coccidioides immitis RS]|uniref:Ubiquitin carboxyl-terminal hydrolase 19 n=4 Tax=Coccidioides immitis TaxID=5501 RepID=J3KHS6_COCIM|nr:uncharacterized protein CIMG_00800 [Coccidioides immitis RS]KMP00692.1 hypothetical protein CIRG_00834 [Coccidioides immitis RMSCC 2394]KMU78190.1 hypothetical protein CISG_07030 [Coccidioides immitis RMSCC 3703]KMU85354.1 hypothetical protein CIHG_03138 [Coccidioides immitis H538.4]TPX26293.1 hypothetical protein DIZ76_011755 [Coccidioides immitis]EAS35446.3 hypothetical protein CIMG_00800 [Coccidioides immitis RS]
MDAQYPFASREDIWRVHEEIKDLYATQLEHGERIAKLERRRDDDARMKSLWGPFSPFPSTVSNPPVQESTYNSPSEPFKGFDQGHQHNPANNLILENEEDTRRGASRANSVRFDESSMHGYYNHANRSASELAPMRTGSGLGGHPLTERSLSHRSDGNKSSSGQSHRTFSLGYDNARADGSTTGTTMTPPPGLFILGPVPCIIRCWLTTHFSNDSLLYAAICSGSHSSAISQRMIQKLALEGDIADKDGARCIKLPVYFPEASICQSSSRAGSPAPHLPAITVQFMVREARPDDDKTIQIFIGSDVLRLHNADILFSRDKLLIVDDERNRISVPLVRPESQEVFKTLSTVPQSHLSPVCETNGDGGGNHAVGYENGDTGMTSKPSQFNLPLRTSTDSIISQSRRSAHFADNQDDHGPDEVHTKSTADEKAPEKSSKAEGTGVWGPWRRDQPVNKSEPSPYLATYQRNVRTRNMKVLKPSKPLSSSRQVSGGTGSSGGEPSSSGSLDGGSKAANGDLRPENPWNRARSSNPVGGASAFGWLNSGQGKPAASGSD